MDKPEIIRLKIIIRNYCEEAVRQFGVVEAARRLGVPRQTINRWRKKWKKLDEEIREQDRTPAI